MLLLLACGEAAEAPPEQEAAATNVLLISIDTLRADHVGSFARALGLPDAPAPTPNIDALADTGVLFSRALSPTPVTLPSHATLLTGTLPPRHGVHANATYHLAPSRETLAETLAARGFATGAVVSSFTLDAQYGLAQGFATYDDVGGTGASGAGLAERRGDETTERALAWLAEHRRSPFFLFVHYYDPHELYEPPAPFRPPPGSDGRDALYAGEVRWVDHCVGQLLDGMAELGLADDTLIVLTSDHGEMLGEHGEATHMFLVYQPALHVPLVIRAPGGAAGRQVDEPVGLLDVTPTVASLLGVPAPAGVQGRDLAPWVVGDTPGIVDAAPAADPVPLYLESLSPTIYGGAPLLGLVSGDWKYIHTTRPELYDLGRDPGETTNRLEDDPARAGELRDALAALLDASLAPGDEARRDLGDDERAQLQALGYVGAPVDDRGAFSLAHDGDDPKDLLAFHEANMEMLALLNAGRLTEARARCEQLLAERPEYVEAHYELARMAFLQGEPIRAIPHLEALIAARPRHADAHSHLAAVQLGQGRLDAAEPLLRRALELRPDFADAHANLGLVLLQTGRPAESLEHFDVAVRAMPETAALHDARGLALARLGRPADAVDAHAEAVRLAPGDARLLCNLGLVLVSAERDAEAVEPLTACVAQAPGMLEARLALARVLASLGRVDDAAREYDELLRRAPGHAAARAERAALSP